MKESEEVWQGEDDGTALVCDGDAVLPTRGRVISLREACHRGLEVAIETEKRLAYDRAQEIARQFVWLEERCDADNEAEDQGGEKG